MKHTLTKIVLILFFAFTIFMLAYLFLTFLFRPLVEINITGGLCSNGTCRSHLNITHYGVVFENLKPIKFINPMEIAELKRNINDTDYKKTKSQPFTGTCPTAYDGSEVTYIFYLSNGSTESVRSCSYKIDHTLPLFQLISKIIEQIYQ